MADRVSWREVSGEHFEQDEVARVSLFVDLAGVVDETTETINIRTVIAYPQGLSLPMQCRIADSLHSAIDEHINNLGLQIEAEAAAQGIDLTSRRPPWRLLAASGAVGGAGCFGLAHYSHLPIAVLILLITVWACVTGVFFNSPLIRKIPWLR